MTLWVCARNPMHGQFARDDCAIVKRQRQLSDDEKKLERPLEFERLACPKCGDFVKVISAALSRTD